jgi:hypothetical protein
MAAREINLKQPVTTREEHSSLTQEDRRNREITVTIDNVTERENINK